MLISTPENPPTITSKSPRLRSKSITPNTKKNTEQHPNCFTSGSGALTVAHANAVFPHAAAGLRQNQHKSRDIIRINSGPEARTQILVTAV